jgi:hypothetical protein
MSAIETDCRIGADVIYQINKRETPGYEEQEYEAPGRGIVTAVEVGPHVTVITVHCKRHDGTEHDETVIEGADLIEWPHDGPDPSEGEYFPMLPGIAWDYEYDGYPTP